MDILLAFLILGFLIFFILGLISPNKSLFFLKEGQTRGKSSLIYGLGFLALLIVFGLTVEIDYYSEGINDLNKEKYESAIENFEKMDALDSLYDSAQYYIQIAQIKIHEQDSILALKKAEEQRIEEEQRLAEEKEKTKAENQQILNEQEIKDEESTTTENETTKIAEKPTDHQPVTNNDTEIAPKYPFKLDLSYDQLMEDLAISFRMKQSKLKTGENRYSGTSGKSVLIEIIGEKENISYAGMIVTVTNNDRVNEENLTLLARFAKNATPEYGGGANWLMASMHEINNSNKENAEMLRNGRRVELEFSKDVGVITLNVVSNEVEKED